jgi:hypothetical protein
VRGVQGWGNLANTLVVVIVMAGFRQNGPPYDPTALEVTWRLSYAIGLVPLTGICLYRLFGLRESAVWQQKREALEAMGGERRVTIQGPERAVARTGTGFGRHKGRLGTAARPVGGSARGERRPCARPVPQGVRAAARSGPSSCC